jgi:hypothetical protein
LLPVEPKLRILEGCAAVFMELTSFVQDKRERRILFHRNLKT